MNERILGLLMDLKINEFSADVIDQISKGEVIEFDISTEEIFNFAESKIGKVKELIHEVEELVESDNNTQHNFINYIFDHNIQLEHFQTFCAGCFVRTGGIRYYSVILYCLLLSLKSFEKIWNQLLFNTLLTIIMKATQITDERRGVTTEEGKIIKLSTKIIKLLSGCINSRFVEYIGVDCIIAVIELSVKLLSVYSDEFTKFMDDITDSCVEFIKSASTFDFAIVIPYIIPAFLLEYMPVYKKISVKMCERRQIFIDLCMDRLGENSELQLIVMKHLLFRCPDKVACRDSVSYTILALCQKMEEREPFFCYLIQLLKTQKSALRIISLDVIMQFINDSNFLENLNMQILVPLINTLLRSINDSAAPVRANTINTISVIVNHLKSFRDSEEVIRALGFPNILFVSLKKRIYDEKLVVRKATLRCLKAMFEQYPSSSRLVEVISTRVRDVAVSLRQESARVLSHFMALKYDERIISIWYDSIFNLCFDADTKTQHIALNLIENYFFAVLGTDVGPTLLGVLKYKDLSILSKIIPLFKIANIDISQYCQTVQSLLHEKFKYPNIWDLANYMIQVFPQHFDSKHILKMWSTKENLPVSYYSIVSKLQCINEKILNDSYDILKNITTNAHEIIYEDKLSYIKGIFDIVFNSADEEDTTIELFNIVNNHINQICENPETTSKDLISIIPQLFLLGEYFTILPTTADYDTFGAQLLISEKLPNSAIIPPKVRAIASVTLGKICLKRKHHSDKFTSVFSKQLTERDNPELKMNCLIILCDLSIKYTSIVNPYINKVTLCFADTYPSVRKQALLIVTRLIVEDFIKMRPLTFFRYVTAAVDKNKDVARFASSCIFDVLRKKNPKILSQFFIDTIMFYSNIYDPTTSSEVIEEVELFKIESDDKRKRAYRIIISHMSDDQLFNMIMLICSKIFSKFTEHIYSLTKNERLLSDSIFIISEIEDHMNSIKIAEASIDDPAGQEVAEQMSKVMTFLHNHLINKVLPVLNGLHRFLRTNNSSHQSLLREFYRKMITKHPHILEELQAHEPLLAAEIENDLAIPQSSSDEEEPIISSGFRSPLLSRISRTPNMALLTPSGSNSPMALLTPASPLTKKREPIPFNLDAEEDE